MRRAVRSVLRLVAAGLIVVGGMTIGLEVLRQRAPEEGFHWLSAVLGAVAVLAGVALFVFSKSLAEQLTDDFDE